MILETILCTIVAWLLYKFFFDVYNHWEKKGIPHLKGTFPFGSKSTLDFLNRYQGRVIEEHYNELDPHPYGGFYMYRKPILLLRDPEVIKQVMVKDFTHFRSRFGKIYDKSDPLMMHLFNLENDLWKSVRVKLTPTFTSGKLKLMYGFFNSCSNEFLKVLKREQKANGSIEVKDAVARFTTDIIATCAFGLEVDSINNPESPFREIGRSLFPQGIGLRRKIILIINNMIPSIRNILHLRIFSKKTEDFLMNVIGNTIEYRKKNDVKRNDFLDLLLEIKEKEALSPNGDIEPLEMDLPMMTAQCFIFFAAGFETSSSVQSYALYELSVNQNIQDKVRSEIKTVLAKHEDKVSYQALQEMSYLEQVINETVRKYPTLPILTRVCTKDWESNSGHLIEKGTLVYIPVFALHHDPKYFPDPDKFDPERFSEENKHSIQHYTFMPFGEGPRLCIGMRFGMLQTKLGIVTVLNNFKVRLTEKTKSPLEFAATTVVTAVKDDIYLKLDELTDKILIFYILFEGGCVVLNIFFTNVFFTNVFFTFN